MGRQRGAPEAILELYCGGTGRPFRAGAPVAYSTICAVEKRFSAAEHTVAAALVYCQVEASYVPAAWYSAAQDSTCLQGQETS
jgi:hypothetical protein